MKMGRMVPLVVFPAGVLMGGSCTSISQEQLMANEQSRVQQERKGYFDRESSEQQREADERAEQGRLHRNR